MSSHSPNRPAVLVVEDEPLLRMDAIDLIEDAGFKTYEAASADAAIEIIRNHEDICFLFTDIDMPGSMDGLKLAEHVRAGWPSVAILIASGVVGVPCPPLARSPTLWQEDNTHHQIRQLKWVSGLEAKAASLKTLVLSAGVRQPSR